MVVNYIFYSSTSQKFRILIRVKSQMKKRETVDLTNVFALVIETIYFDGVPLFDKLKNI